MIRALLLALIGSLLFAGEPTRMEAWKRDLGYLQERLEKDHPKVDHYLPLKELRKEFRTLVAQVPALTDAEITVEIARILARIRDGHTMLPLEFDVFRATTGFRKLPLRLHWFEEGLVVTEARNDLAPLLGARVVAVGGKSLKAALSALAPLVSHDGNGAAALRWKSADLLVTAEVLAARKLSATTESVVFTLERDGKRSDVVLTPEPNPKRPFDGKPMLPEPGTWTEIQPQKGQAPAWWRMRRSPWAFEVVEGGRTTYLAFNKVKDTPEETFEAFCKRLFQASHSAERLVVDLRWNTGGNGTLLWPLLEGIRENPRFMKPGGLRVLVGPYTFSAGMMAAVKLEQTGRPIFFGEPTSASPNHYGDTTLVTLPASQITLLHSGTFWQLSQPQDRRVSIQPKQPATFRLKDLLKGVDTVLVKAGIHP